MAMESAKKRLVLAVTLAEQGGVQQFMVGFAVWLQKLGHEVAILAGDGAWLPERCAEQKIPFIRLKKMGREIDPFRDPAAIWELRGVLKRLKPDAVHLNSTKMGVVGSVAARLAGVPIVAYRIGGWVFREALSPSKLAFYKTAERLTAPLKDNIVCVNPDDVTLAQTVGIKPRNRLMSVPNGIDLTKFDAALLPHDAARSALSVATHYSLLSTHFLFGTTANFYPPKDLPRYLDACKIVHDAEPSARFLILGDGMQRAEIEEKRHALGLDGIVLLPGARNDAQTLLKGFDAFVLPSSKEGMAFSLLEAMAAGLPCVATDVGAGRWMLADGGLVVQKMQPQILAEAMLRVLREPELAARLGREARHQAESRFPMEATYRGNLEALSARS